MYRLIITRNPEDWVVGVVDSEGKAVHVRRQEPLAYIVKIQVRALYCTF
jgi:hypothetical protein